MDAPGLEGPPEPTEQEIREASLNRDVLIAVAKSIDWNEQEFSCFRIGEDAAEWVLVRLGFDFNEGLCNEAVEKFLASLSSQKVGEKND